MKIFTIIFTLLITGCSNVHYLTPVDMSQGFEKKSTIYGSIYGMQSKDAVSSGTFFVQFVSMDDKEIYPIKNRWAYTIVVPEGEHTLKLRVLLLFPYYGPLLAMAASSQANSTISEIHVNIEAGKTYVANAKVKDAKTVLGNTQPISYEYSVIPYTGEGNPMSLLDMSKFESADNSSDKRTWGTQMAQPQQKDEIFPDDSSEQKPLAEKIDSPHGMPKLIH